MSASDNDDITNTMSSSSSSLFSSRPRVQFTKTTESTNLQQATELECEPYFCNLATLSNSQLEHLRQTNLIMEEDDSLAICLVSKQHLQYVSQVFQTTTLPLKSHFSNLDSSRSWILYWCLQSCDLLGKLPENNNKDAIVQTLLQFWTQETVMLATEIVQKDARLQTLIVIDDEEEDDKDGDHAAVSITIGGFGGGPQQLAHAATTYAAVLALCILWTDSAKDFLTAKRNHLYAWMITLQEDDGSFRMHHDGEIDVRATYCLVCVAKLLNLLDNDNGKGNDSNGGPNNFNITAAIDFVARCQTWEGGFGGEPYAEAHGGYAFCATAALFLLQGFDKIDTESLTAWLVQRQMAFEGGFNGRANKLVDGCYSFWQGGAMAIVSMLDSFNDTANGDGHDYKDPWLQQQQRQDETKTSVLFDQQMLERYILLCAQDVSGGLRDKPSKSRDCYHTCYNLSGLSVAQHCSGDDEPAFGSTQHSRVEATHPVYNIRISRVREVLSYFKQLK